MAVHAWGSCGFREEGRWKRGCEEKLRGSDVMLRNEELVAEISAAQSRASPPPFLTHSC